MSVRTDQVNLRVTIQDNQALEQLSKYNTRTREIRQEMKGLKKDSEAFKVLDKELKETTASADALKKQVGLVGMSLKDLRREANSLRAIRDNMVPGTQAFIDADKRLGEVNDRIGLVTKNASGMERAFSAIWGQVKQFGLLAAGVIGLDFLTGKIGDVIRRQYELSDAQADVQRTTNLTTAEVADLNKELGKINTRTGRKELLGLAYEAGKLGIDGKEDVLEFVKAANKITVALGEDLGKGAITSLGKLNDIFKTKEIYGYGEGMLKLGNVINKLGAIGTSAEAYIVEFSRRIAGTANTAKLAVPDVLALGATLDELGITSEVASTVFAQVLPNMFSKTAAFAKAAGVDVDEFSATLNRSTSEALIMFLEGLQKNSKGLGDMSARLESVSIDGTRGSNVLIGLAQNTAKLRERVIQANNEYENGSSILQEYNTKNENFAANVDKLKKAFGAFLTNSAISQGIKALINDLAQMATSTESAAESVQAEQEALNLLVTQIQLTNLGTKERRDLLNDLQSQYPDFLKNLDIETVTNQQLASQLAEVNKQYIAKIALAKQDDTIKRQADSVAEALIKQKKAETEITQSIAVVQKMFTDSGYSAPVRKTFETLIEYARRLAAQAEKIGIDTDNKKTFTAQGGLAPGVGATISSQDRNFKAELSKLESTITRLEMNNKLLDKLKKDRDQLSKQFEAEGILPSSVEQNTISTLNNITTAAAPLSKVQEEAKAAANSITALEARLAELNKQLLATDTNDTAGLQSIGEALDKAEKDLVEARKKLLLALYGPDALSLPISTLLVESLDEAFKEAAEALDSGNLEGVERMQAEVAKIMGRMRKPSELPSAGVPTKDEILGEMVGTASEWSAHYDTILNIEQGFANLSLGIQAARFEAEKRMLNAQLNTKKISQAKYEKEIQKLNNERAQKERRAELIKAAFQIPQAALSTFVSTPGPLWVKIVAAALATAFASAQVGMMAKTPVEQYYEGGYTDVTGAQDGRSYRARRRSAAGMAYEPTILVGERKPEYVVSGDLMENPAIAANVSLMEALRTGRIALPDYQGALSAIATRQMFAGGYTTPGTAAAQERVGRNPSTGKEIRAASAESMLIGTIARLNAILDKGIIAIIPDGTIEDLEDRIALLKKIEEDSRN